VEPIGWDKEENSYWLFDGELEEQGYPEAMTVTE
jgi:hypothetical protein